MEALGTWLDSRGCSEASLWHRISKANSMFYAKCDPKLPVKRRIDAFYSRAGLRRRPNEFWADHMKRTGPIVARQLKKHGQPTFTNVGDATCANCCLANGSLSR